MNEDQLANGQAGVRWCSGQNQSADTCSAPLLTNQTASENGQILFNCRIYIQSKATFLLYSYIRFDKHSQLCDHHNVEPTQSRYRAFIFDSELELGGPSLQSETCSLQADCHGAPPPKHAFVVTFLLRLLFLSAFVTASSVLSSKFAFSRLLRKCNCRVYSFFICFPSFSIII